MRKIVIDSQFQVGASLPHFDEKQLRYEPMFFSAMLDYAWEHGGKPTKAFIDALPKEWRTNDVILDSRVHMLMQGWWPAVPGWHHDDVPRERSDGQPEYQTPSYRSEHVMALYNGNVCPTEFAVGESEFADVPLGKVYYEQWHKVVEAKIQNGELYKQKAPNEYLIFFNDRTWHQAVPALRDGWRFFIRASRNTNRKVLNETRAQVQVYLSNPMAGW